MLKFTLKMMDGQVLMYIYTGDGDSAVKLAGNWPGTAMVAEDGDNEDCTFI